MVAFYSLGGLYKNAPPPLLICLNASSCLGRKLELLLELFRKDWEAWPCWRRCVFVGGSVIGSRL